MDFRSSVSIALTKTVNAAAKILAMIEPDEAMFIIHSRLDQQKADKFPKETRKELMKNHTFAFATVVSATIEIVSYSTRRQMPF